MVRTPRRRAGSRKADGTPKPPSACVAIAADITARTALQTLFSELPADLGAAYVMTLSRSQGYKATDVARDLEALANMPVETAIDGAPLLPDHIYVADDESVVTVDVGTLRVGPAQPTDGRIDSLLISAAEAYDDACVVVVLAGLELEGTTGVAATKRFGGFAIAEVVDERLEPDGEAVTAAGIADLCTSVDRIPHEIAAYIANLTRTIEDVGATDRQRDDLGQQIARIAAILRNATGNDFHGYKHATFQRRIQRRMQVVQVDDVERYIERLRADASEVQHLFQDLLIGVTQFFRDPAEFEVLEREVIPKIFEGKGADDRVRLWVLGCATGEEAYSLAILLREHMARMDVAPHAQIFATDIDGRALAVARSGRYLDSIARHISPERLARWFVKEGATYSVVKELREMCIFSPHNLIKDAPFSRIDLLSCRNLLIYLNGDLQDRVIPIFHFSLRPGGYLFLGPAENVTRHQKLFAPIDRRNRIFRRLDTPTRVLPDFPLSPRSERSESGGEAGRPTPMRTLTSRTGRRVEQIAERYSPAYVVVDENYDVLHFSGRTGRFLEPASGVATLNLLNLVHRDLRLDLRTVLHKTATQGTKSEAPNLRLGADGTARTVTIVVEPIKADNEAGTMLVLFQDGGPALEGGAVGNSAEAHDEHVQRLDAELRLTKERLQTTIEELESTNEELKSSNEEYQSINEELQSANEELETSKEELQAVNEELQTVNGELAHRVAELGRSNSDLKNFLESTQIATIFLDNDLRLRSFTPASSEIFHLIEADVGRPIAHISARVAYPDLQADARKVIKSLGQVEREVSSVDEDRQFLVRVLPYRSVDNFIAGVVVTFLEITGTARAEAALRASERRFGEAQQLAGIGVWERNFETGELWWSSVVYQLWGEDVADAPRPLAERRIHEEDRGAYEKALEMAKTSGELDVEYRVVLPSGAVRWLAETGRKERAGGASRMLGVTQDITERKQTETRQRLLLGELQHRVRNILGVVRSIVARTLRGSGAVDELAQHLDGRLETLSRVQNVFTRSADATVGLDEIVRDELLSVGASEAQVVVRGPSVQLQREAAETLALALHELTTNALKYGALATTTGHLTIEWRRMTSSHGPRLSLDWREEGVRALDANPTRSGFGRELLERGLPFELGATTSLEFAPGGVHASIELPLTDKVTVAAEGGRDG